MFFVNHEWALWPFLSVPSPKVKFPVSSFVCLTHSFLQISTYQNANHSTRTSNCTSCIIQNSWQRWRGRPHVSAVHRGCPPSPHTYTHTHLPLWGYDKRAMRLLDRAIWAVTLQPAIRHKELSNVLRAAGRGGVHKMEIMKGGQDPVYKREKKFSFWSDFRRKAMNFIYKNIWAERWGFENPVAFFPTRAPNSSFQNVVLQNFCRLLWKTCQNDEILLCNWQNKTQKQWNVFTANTVLLNLWSFAIIRNKPRHSWPLFLKYWLIRYIKSVQNVCLFV